MEIFKKLAEDVIPITRLVTALKKPIRVKARQLAEPVVVETANGPVEARRGDWILTSPDGDVWPITEERFDKTYEILAEE